MKEWPKVEDLAGMEFETLGDAVKAVAALPPEDDDRKLFISSYCDLEYPAIFRAANADRAKLIAAATSNQRGEEMLWELPAGLSPKQVSLLHACYVLARAGIYKCFDALFEVLPSIGAIQYSGPAWTDDRKLDDEFCVFLLQQVKEYEEATKEFRERIESEQQLVSASA